MADEWTWTSNIVEAGNTSYGFPLALLAHRGFTVLEPPDYRNQDEWKELWALHPDGTRMIASSPLALLGLLSILDHLGPDWYDRPKVDLPDSVDPIVLNPESIEEMADDELPDARTAFGLLCRFQKLLISSGETREDLVTACRRYLEMMRKEDEGAQR